MSIPKVSVIIPTYKRSEMLSRAIDSVLNQTLEDVEVIVVDDNDSNTRYRLETEKRMEQYADNNKVFYIKHPMNRNGAAARNTGIRYAQGEYIAFLDDDDEFLPEKLALQVERMDSLSDEWGACYTGYKKINNGGSIQFSEEKREGDLLIVALMKNLYVGSGSNILARKRVVEEINGYDDSFRRNQDLEFLVRILEKYRIAYVDCCGFIIHYEKRKRNMTYDELMEINKQYLRKFNPMIQKLGKDEQKKIYTMLILMDFRIALGRRMLFRGFKMLKQGEVSLYTAIRYIIYMLRRGITKKSYGFDI